VALDAPWRDTSSLERAHAFQLTRIGRLLRVHLVRSLESLGTDLGPEQFFILFRLHESDGRRQQELVDPVLDDRPNISRHVAALVRRGLVERRPDPTDGRAHLLHLTTAGRVYIVELIPGVLRVREELFGGISPDDFTAFDRVLAHLTQALTP
jgi:DNA-binding MarR family transcriptional regulator